MKKILSKTTCVALSGLLLTAVLAPATAQPPNGPKETITIKGEGDKKPDEAPKPAAAPAPVTTLKKTEVKRDPFITGVVEASHSRVKTVKSVAAKPGAPAGAGAKKETKEVEVAAPQVTIHGIVLSASGNRAILVSPNQTYIVKSGDKLGDYHVAAIDARHVTFKYKDKAFKIKMEDEFSANAGGKKK